MGIQTRLKLARKKVFLTRPNKHVIGALVSLSPSNFAFRQCFLPCFFPPWKSLCLDKRMISLSGACNKHWVRGVVRWLGSWQLLWDSGTHFPFTLWHEGTRCWQNGAADRSWYTIRKDDNIWKLHFYMVGSSNLWGYCVPASAWSWQTLIEGGTVCCETLEGPTSPWHETR